MSEPKLDQPQKDTTGALSRFIAEFMFKVSLLAPADVEDGGLLQKDPTVRVQQVSKGQNFSHRCRNIPTFLSHLSSQI